MNTSCRGRLAFLLLIFIIIVSLSSCRFKVPGANEGQRLVENKTFSGAVPAWVMQSKNSPRQPMADAGVVPQSYSAPPAVRITSQSVPDAAVAAIGKTPEEDEKDVGSLKPEEAGVETGAAGQSLTVDAQKDTSPLDRIAKVCPGAEPAVKEALRTTTRASRIAQYVKLTSRCPQSWDLWLWLGKDYESDGRLVEAGRCYERVLTIDYGNEVAQALLANVRQRLNQKPAGQ